MSVGGAITRLGERLDVHWLIENPLVFRFYHQVARASAPGAIETLEECFPEARRYADIGAGTGAYAAEARRHGREVVACEYSRVGRLFARAQGVDCRQFDLSSDPPARLGGPFDLAYCFEVGQQLEPELGRRLVEFAAAQAPIVVFSSAQPHHGGVGAINKRPKGYWIELFERVGMHADEERSKRVSDGFAAREVPGRWLIENVIVFVASSPK